MKEIIIIVFIAFTILGCDKASQKPAGKKDAADAIYFGGDIITMEGDSAAYA